MKKTKIFLAICIIMAILITNCYALLSNKVYADNVIAIHFDTPNYTTNKLTIVSDNTISGPFALIATYNDLTSSQTFRLEISITVEDDTTMNFDDLNLKVAIPKDSSLSLDRKSVV